MERMTGFSWVAWILSDFIKYSLPFKINIILLLYLLKGRLPKGIDYLQNGTL